MSVQHTNSAKDETGKHNIDPADGVSVIQLIDCYLKRSWRKRA